nr:hypothetical protein [Tanacetum cinerariifolium]
MWTINPQGNKQHLLMPCLCTKCLNHIERKVEEVHFYLFKNRIDLRYTKWSKHGEKDELSISALKPVNATTEFVDDTDFALDIPTDGPATVEMVNATKDNFDEDDLVKFQELLSDAEKPLYKTINDYPALGKLCGCPYSGFKDCVVCRKDTYCVRLSTSSKQSYGGHKQYLPYNHAFKKQKKAFNGQQEFLLALNLMIGEQIYNEVQHIKNKWGKGKRTNNEALENQEDMRGRVETLLNVSRKTKDRVNARLDLAELGVKPELFATQEEDKTTLPPAELVGVKRDTTLGYTLVDLNNLGHKFDSFILASQAQKVFYVKDQINKKLSIVFKTPHKNYKDMYDEVDKEFSTVIHQYNDNILLRYVISACLALGLHVLLFKNVWRFGIAAFVLVPIALEAKKESSDDDTLTSRSDDEEYAMVVRNFKFFRRKGKFVRQPREEKTSFRQWDDKKSNSDRKCFRCGDPNHLTGECPKPP